MRGVYEEMRHGFVPETLIYVPSDQGSIDRARGWSAPGFPVYLP